MKLSIIIPVFNEEKTISEILKRVEAVNLDNWEKEIIVVNDGSTDNTGKIIEECFKTMPFVYIQHQKNQGKGTTIKTGLEKATGDFVLIQDADLEYDPNDYQKLLKLVEEGSVVVYGSRNLDKNTQRGYFFYFLGGKLITTFCNLLFGSKLTDINTGYKLFKTEIIKNLNLQSKGFEFCEEVTAKILKRKIPIKEIAISYYPRTFKEGKKIKFKDGLIAILTLFKYRFLK
ncbi:MAG: glycosyltransferase family 2 protein [Patescibacteria group bacterium]|nr:glycosyltransferase family 2 protein [Patescibacteria group bacterium]